MNTLRSTVCLLHVSFYLCPLVSVQICSRTMKYHSALGRRQRFVLCSHARYKFSLRLWHTSQASPPIMLLWHAKWDYCRKSCQAQLLIGWPLEVPAKKSCYPNQFQMSAKVNVWIRGMEVIFFSLWWILTRMNLFTFDQFFCFLL